jgi:hypothetical protein
MRVVRKADAYLQMIHDILNVHGSHLLGLESPISSIKAFERCDRTQ